MPTVAARRYAKAVFELAQQDGSIEAWERLGRSRSWSDGRPIRRQRRLGRRTGSTRCARTMSFRAPGATTRCTASVEGGSKNLFCRRSPEGRYQVVFYTDSIIVWKNGNPDKPAFSARWQR